VRSALILLAVLMFGILGCNWRTATAPAVAPSATGAANESSDAYPSKDDVVDYLEGKTIARSDPTAKAGPQFVFQRDHVEAMEVEKSGTMVSDGPWTTTVRFIAKSGMERYAVTMTVQHRRVENKRAFFGYRVHDVELQ
jgi:hypothetical protein